MGIRAILIGLIVLAASGLSIIAMQLLVPQQRVRAPAADIAAVERPQPIAVRLLAVTRPIAPGSLLRAEDLAALDATALDGLADRLRDTPEIRAELAGALVRRYLEPGQPIGGSDVLRPRERGFLAAVLRPNMRAITIGVDAVTGTAGLIWPGDRVDVLLTQTLGEQVASFSRRVVGETVLSDVRVIAVDQQLAQGASGANTSPAGKVARTVTLEATPQESERLAVAAQLGRLSLTIRAMAALPDEEAPRRPSVFGSDVSPALSQVDSADRPVGVRMRIIQGDERQEVTFR